MTAGRDRAVPDGAAPPAPVTGAPTRAWRLRGPLRPPTLRPARVRQSRRLASHVFRALDVLALVVLGAVVLSAASPAPVLRTPLASVAPVAGAGWLLAAGLRSTGSYRFPRQLTVVQHLVRVLSLGLVVGSAAVLAARLLGSGTEGERAVGLFGVLGPVVLLALHTLWWLLVRRWRRDGTLTSNIVLVGATSHAEQLVAEALALRDVHVLGIYDDRLARSPDDVLGVPVLGDTAALLTNHRILPAVDLVVVAIDPSATARVREIVDRLAVLPNECTVLVDQPEASARSAALARLVESPLAPVGRATSPQRRAFHKRVQDLVIGIPALLLLAPVLAVLAVIVRRDSPGPALFRQRRHGFNDEEIVVLKFRTMRVEETDARAERQVTADDDRVTRVGRVLRRTSLDEMPQLVNVIRGEMSLVGPRPHAIGMRTGEVESARLVAEYAHRHRIKPGMTGLAAVRGSRGPMHDADDVRRRVALDVEYIERQSAWLDLQILVVTLPRMLGDRLAVR